MATLHIRDLKPATKEGLRIRAAKNGKSMEQEAREILDTAVEPLQPKRSFWSVIQEAREKFGTADFAIPERNTWTDREAPDFSTWPD